MIGTTNLFVIITLFSLCAHSSPLGKKVKQERYLRARKKRERRGKRGRNQENKKKKRKERKKSSR